MTEFKPSRGSQAQSLADCFLWTIWSNVGWQDLSDLPAPPRGIGPHSDAVTIPAGATQIVRSDTSGLRPDGTLPEDFAEEAGQASDNACEALRRLGAGLSDVGLVRSWFAERDDSGAHVRVRKDVISHRPA